MYLCVILALLGSAVHCFARRVLSGDGGRHAAGPHFAAQNEQEAEKLIRAPHIVSVRPEAHSILQPVSKWVTAALHHG